MRIAVLSDIHGDLHKLPDCAETLKNSDCIIVAGDISRHGDFYEIETVINELSHLNKNIFAVPGNMDGEKSVQLLEKLKVNIHGKKVEFKGYKIVGCGGATKTPFGTPFEISEEDLANCINANLSEDEKTILVCHNPPYKTKTDKTLFGLHAGSKLLRKIIEEKQPEIFVSGHIHEASGTDKIGKTVLLNPGPFRRGTVGIIEIDNDNEKINAKVEQF